jgi:hypothetical protein
MKGVDEDQTLNLRLNSKLISVLFDPLFEGQELRVTTFDFINVRSKS